MADQNLNPTAPAWLPAKFWDDQTGEVRVEHLARSYGELERMKGAPGALDLPASATDYQLNVDDLLGIDDTANQRMFDEGFSNAQAQVVYDLAAERLMPMVQQITQDADDARQGRSEERRVGEEWSTRGARDREKTKGRSRTDTNGKEDRDP